MACEGCAIEFTSVNRKEECTDCLLYFCKICLTRCPDTILKCDKCSILSRRPLIRSSLLEMHLKDLEQYLTAKKISTRGCFDREDFINLVIQYANVTDNTSTDNRTGSNFEGSSIMNVSHEFTPNIMNSSTSNTPNTDGQENVKCEVPTYKRNADSWEYSKLPQTNTEPILTSSNHSNSAPRSHSSSNINDLLDRLNLQTSYVEPTPIIRFPEMRHESSFTAPSDVEIDQLSDCDCCSGCFDSFFD